MRLVLNDEIMVHSTYHLKTWNVYYCEVLLLLKTGVMHAMETRMPFYGILCFRIKLIIDKNMCFHSDGQQ